MGEHSDAGEALAQRGISWRTFSAMTARMTVFRTRRHVEVVGVSCPPDGRTTLRVDFHPFDEFIEHARMGRVLLNPDQLHLTTPH